MSHIIVILKEDSFSMPEYQREVNSNGLLIPFLNGVLHTKTLNLLPHNPDYYLTHIIPIHFNFSDSLINTPMSQFLIQICNFSLIRLQVLRACFYCLFTNDLSNQIALYIHGPGGTGKSTLINILKYLLGPEASLSTSIDQLSSRFGIVSLLNKLLVVLNDISFLPQRESGNQIKVITDLVTSDTMSAEKKYYSSFQFTPSAFLIITSNYL
jgi:putative DNA primase/helicase